MTQYTSKNFSDISDKLISEISEKLIHKNVLNTDSTSDNAFSNHRNHLVKVVDLPTKTISMTIGGLEPNQSTRNHRHSYETIIYVISGNGKSIIDNQEVYWSEGDAFYVPVWAWHTHINISSTDKVLYIACENAPLMQNLGAAIREEENN